MSGSKLFMLAMGQKKPTCESGGGISGEWLLDSRSCVDDAL